MSKSLTVITVCKDAEFTIFRTLKNIEFLKTRFDFEYIVKDGNSIDNTQRKISIFDRIIDKYESKKDDGIYDAMNQAIDWATGNYIYFLNAGDILFYRNFNLYYHLLTQNYYDLIYGSIWVYNYNTKFKKLRRHEMIDSFYLSHRTICHQALFTKKSAFSVIGKYSMNYKYIADYEWLLKFFNSNSFHYQYIDKPIGLFDQTGITSTQPGRIKDIINNEYKNIRSHYFSKAQLRFFNYYNYNLKSHSYSHKLRKLLSLLRLNTIYS